MISYTRIVIIVLDHHHHHHDDYSVIDWLWLNSLIIQCDSAWRTHVTLVQYGTTHPDWFSAQLVIVGGLYTHPIRWVGVTSVSRRFFILRSFHGKKVLQLPLQCLESGSLHCVLVPALQHDIVEGCRATRWTWHTVTMLHLMQYFGICHTCNNQS